ncbi:RNA polymerase sigma factor [Pedobacter caeni]|uniref:RNA polymerase sigma-70 factor, ECF subfamily n=1 Tax=Pedobacter caeni TaxID=288992 RepID=A0A1M5B9Q2_9SPHI|nr:sigma-70 family RNA polymerase sigma factor [Pedobacter caeni]SHF39150.1 RNA polymerase sigma-70 factor, ECF subfamily [Pedobacter caeni]
MSISPIPNELELIRQISNGDKRAFTILFDAYYKSLGQYIYKLTESLEVTEEIVQDVFIKVWLKREELVHIKSFSNYIFILSRNHTLNHLRKQATAQVNFRKLEKETGAEVMIEEEEDSYEGFRLLIDQAIESLPAQQKKVYQLCKFERLKYEQVAAQLNLSVETVRKHVFLANKAIKEHVKRHMDEAVLIVLLSPLIFI